MFDRGKQKMKIILSFALALVFSFNVFAEKFVIPDQKIVGAETPIALGELVDLSVSPIKSPPQYLVETAYTWKVLDGYTEKRVRDYNGGVFFGAGIQPKRLKALVAVTYLYAVKEQDKITETAARTAFLSTDVLIGDEAPPAPEPNPNPNPNPEPEPNFPEGKYNLSPFIYNLTKTKINLSKSDKAKQANALAKSFEGIAAAIAAGTIDDQEDILKKTAEANRSSIAAVGGDRSKWEIVFNEIQEKLYGLYKDNKMVTKQDFASAWREIAAGFKAFK